MSEETEITNFKIIRYPQYDGGEKVQIEFEASDRLTIEQIIEVVRISASRNPKYTVKPNYDYLINATP